MAQPESRRAVTDPRALRALASPVRLALLNYVMAFGPCTASQCAGVVGATPSNCSYHLRQLAAFGLVEPVDAEDGRERPWRATATGFSFGQPPGGGAEPDPALHVAEVALAAVKVEEQTRLAHAILDRAGRLPDAWRQATAFNGYALRLNPAELSDLTAALDRLIRPYIALTREDAPDDAATVHLSFQAFLHPDGLGDQ